MASFIVISTSNHLHYLVDNIKKCCPLNPDIRTNISTGKILKTEQGFQYEYSVCTEESKNGQAKDLSYWITNQIAQFRLVNSIPNDNLVNIFLLENPITDTDFNEAEMWLNAFNDVFRNGHDKSFCVYRILFTYDLNDPSDVKKQISPNIVSEILNSHKQCVENNEFLFERYIFYIDNQKSDSAAFCVDKKEHDLKLPRLLTDFMMLSTNIGDAYGVRAAISSPEINTKCFSIGFGESMYYYPDVAEYYQHGDARDLYEYILNTDDESFPDVSNKILDIDKYPFGLKKRQKRLSAFFENVPFSEDIVKYPLSADFEIYKSLSLLEGLLLRERDKEYELFFNSPIYQEQQKLVKSIQKKLETIEIGDDESEQLRKQLITEKAKLDKMISDFKPKCPLYIDRPMIYDSISLADEDEKGNIEKLQSTIYQDLLNFVISKQFIEFVKSSEENIIDNDSTQNLNVVKNETVSSNSGCLMSWLFFWKHSEKRSDEENLPDSVIDVESNSLLKQIETIKIKLRNKEEFKKFSEKVRLIQEDYKKERDKCNSFKLTNHLNHFYPLIELNKLKEIQKESFDSRRLIVINSWNAEDKHTLKSLVDIAIAHAQQHTKENYSFIDWEKPFPFVSKISKDHNLALVCNQLLRKSSPLVNYNLDLGNNENRIIKMLYSDIPSIEEDIQEIRSQLDFGNEITAHFSSHIASKICMIQFLPMDERILCNLVDRNDEDF